MWPVAIVSVFVIALSAFIRLTHGWDARLSGSFRDLSEKAVDYHRIHFGGAGYPLDGMIGDVHSNFDLLLSGDSHSLAYVSGFDEVLRKESLAAKINFRHGCFISNIVTRSFGNSLDLPCQSQAKKLRELLKDNAKPFAIAQNWNAYKSDLIYPTGKRLMFNSNQDYVEFIWKMVVELRNYLGHERPFIVIGQLPRSINSAGVVTCLIRPQWFRSPCVDGINYPQKSADPMGVNSYFSSHAKENSIIFIDPSQAFCSGGTCILMKDSDILYSDVGHLSKTGSRRAVEKMWPEIRPLLTKTSNF